MSSALVLVRLCEREGEEALAVGGGGAVELWKASTRTCHSSNTAPQLFLCVRVCVWGMI